MHIYYISGYLQENQIGPNDDGWVGLVGIRYKLARPNLLCIHKLSLESG